MCIHVMEMSAVFSYLILKKLIVCIQSAAPRWHVTNQKLPENHSFPVQQAAVVTKIPGNVGKSVMYVKSTHLLKAIIQHPTSSNSRHLPFLSTLYHPRRVPNAWPFARVRAKRGSPLGQHRPLRRPSPANSCGP